MKPGIKKTKESIDFFYEFFVFLDIDFQFKF